MVLEPGTYYIKMADDYASGYYHAFGCTLRYTVSYDNTNMGATMETAIPLAAGTWLDIKTGTRYYSLGELAAQDQVRYSFDAGASGGYVYLVSQNGNSVDSDYYANRYFDVTYDGNYYLKVEMPDLVDDNQDPVTGRIRYDIASGTDLVTDIELADSVTLTVGETWFVDLRMAPYTAMCGYTPGLNKNADSTVATYDSYSGRITALAEGTTEMTFRAYNGSSYIYKTIQVNVAAPVPAASVAITNAPAELTLGTSAYLSASLLPADAWRLSLRYGEKEGERLIELEMAK